MGESEREIEREVERDRESERARERERENGERERGKERVCWLHFGYRTHISKHALLPAGRGSSS